MTILNKSKSRVKKLRKLILLILNDLYLFPQSDKVIRSSLKDQFPNITSNEIRSNLYYLERRGYLSISESNHDVLNAKITSDGIDLVEGAVSDIGVLGNSLSESTLQGKRIIRRSILIYCGWYPDSFNSDDEIYSELREQENIAVTLDRIRMEIWYLSGKGYLDMKSQPIFGDFIYLARITAKGQDLIDNTVTDPGISSDG